MKVKQIGWVLVGAVVGVLVACSGSSSADTGLTQSQVQTMISAAVTPLQQQIATLQTQVQTLQASSTASQAQIFIKAPNAGAAIAASIRQTRRVTYAASASTSSTLPSPCNWTLTGRPPDSNALNGSTYSGISCLGYAFNISGATSTGSGIIQILPGQYVVAFDGASCTGDAYLMPWSVSVETIEIVAQAGMVFTLNPQAPDMSGVDASNPSQYWYLKAGAQPVSMTAASYWSSGEGCLPAGSAQLPSPLQTQEVWPIETNDAAVTGIPSAPIPGPVLISN